MPKPFWASYLPSILVALVVVLAGFLSDEQNRRLVLQEQRSQAAAQMILLKARLEGRLNANIQSVKGLAALLGVEKDIGQERFSLLAGGAVANQYEVINIAAAPDLVVTLVYPFEGNESVVGLDYRKNEGQREAVFKVRDTGEMILAGPLELVQSGQGLIARLPVFRKIGEKREFWGILSAVYDVERLLHESGFYEPDLDIEVALVSENTIAEPQSIFFGSRDVLEDDPVRADVHMAAGDWQIFARPVDGWNADWVGLVSYRAGLVFLAIIVLTPTIIANRLAMAREQTIREMAKVESRLRGMARDVPGTIISVIQKPGEEAKTDFVSGRSEDIWGLTQEEIYRDFNAAMRLIEPEYLDGVQEVIAAAEAGAENSRYRFQIRTPAGKLKWLELRGHANKFANGTINWFTLALDITDEIRKNEDYQRQSEIIHTVQKRESIGQLSGGVAHDFNNLLAVILGNQELLREELTDEAQIRFVDASIGATLRGANLTKSMLAFARRARLDPEPVNLNVLVRETNDWIERTLPENIEVATSLADGLWEIEIDRSATESALLNLIVNARDAMPNGGKLDIVTANIEIGDAFGITQDEDFEAGKYVTLKVSDNGHGISKQDLGSIFEPFFTTKPPGSGSGSGLGLSMIQGFMRQSGGMVRVATTPETGTEFTLFFRALDASGIKVQDDAQAIISAVSSGVRILVVEDEQRVLEVVIRILRRAGYEVASATTGDAAKAIFDEDSDFDLLLTDMVMPGGLQGGDLAKVLQERRPELPVIFMSGYASTSPVTGKEKAAGALYLMKPVRRNELLVAIENALGGVTGQV